MSIYETYDSYVARGINQERLSAILEFAGDSILDVGCGSGAYILKLANQYQISGVDYQKFPTWDEMPNLFSISDATNLSDYSDKSVDTITCFETLEHLANPEKALSEFYRVCRKNVILTVPNCEVTSAMLKSELIYKPWIDRTHIQFFNMNSLSNLVEKSGFKVIKKYYINKISLWPFLEEAFDFTGLLGVLAKKILLRKVSKDYYITCLVIAEKTCKQL